MWEQYKKTFAVTQAVILTVAVAVTFSTRAWNAGALFFVIMQFGAIFGAVWATRIKRMVPRPGALPLRGQ
jgi:H+/Cl- antiporter ClcA